MQQKHEERKKKILQKTKKTLICIMYIKIKLMSTFTNMGDIYIIMHGLKYIYVFKNLGMKNCLMFTTTEKISENT